MNRAIAVAVGGALGAVLRYHLQNWTFGRWGAGFPYGTLLINISGAFFIGMVMTVLLEHLHISPIWRVFLVTGILGGFTTFSALTWEAYALCMEGKALLGALYVGGSLLGGMLALLLGVFFGRMI